MTTEERLIEFLNSEEYAKYWSRRARDLQCEREEAEDSKECEIVLNMFNEDFTLEQISTATKLSLNEINTIIADSKE